MKKRKSSKKATAKSSSRRKKAEPEPPLHPIVDVPLHETARRRYLNYAMSVITSRALPDVRDGLKPVQRRILYSMQHELRLTPGSKPVKCARIVGDVLGKFHPHGDTAVYDALVRMAQDFSLREPLVDGQGNFGSVDGDSAAAYRYTEATLRALSMQLLEELPRDTVDFRPNYDGKTREPVVLPARFPSLLVNGATGIAVGMASNIPPHNLAEVTEACEALTRDRELTNADLVKYIKGPDFPLGGQILSSRAEIRQVYEEGQGAIRVRGEYAIEDGGKSGPRLVIRSIPYMVQKDTILRAIGDLVEGRKVPQIVDVRDESTDQIRVVIEIKKEADPDQVMAYLFKNTGLQANFNVNLTCLLPVELGSTAETCAPSKVDLKTLLLHFVEFRYRVVERRFEFDLRKLRERIHILEGMRIIFDALDEAIQIIRRSDGRKDAAEKLMKRFGLDEIQVNAILDLRLYRLAKLEIKLILDELREKKAEAERIEEILGDPERLWTVVRDEFAALRQEFGTPRRTRVGARGVEETEISEEAFILDEDAYVVLSHDGWIKRVTRIADKEKLRLRPGDSLQAVIAGNTRRTAVFLSNFGSAYTIRINDIPASRGFGDPIQKLFKFRDRERVVAAWSLDERVLTDIGSVDDPEGTEPTTQFLAVTSSGYASRGSIAVFAEPSTRTGRKFIRLKDDEEVVGVHVVHKKRKEPEVLMIATREGRVLLFAVDQVKFLSGPGRGVIAIKLSPKDRVLGTGVSRAPSHSMTAYTTGNRKVDITTRRYKPTGRGGKGVEVIKRGGLSKLDVPEVDIPELPEPKKGRASGGATNGDGKRRPRAGGGSTGGNGAGRVESAREEE